MIYDGKQQVTTLFGGGEYQDNTLYQDTWVYALPRPGDSDHDGDVDLEDFAAFQRCFGLDPSPECLDAFDYDGDGDVDLDDWADLEPDIGGPNQPITLRLYGPWPSPSRPYLSFADSPFANLDFSGAYFWLEDFEDGSLNTPGVSIDWGNINGPSAGNDSVDGDDGAIDGSGMAGWSWYADTDDFRWVAFTFDAGGLGGQLPTHAGVVWTDGNNDIEFEAYDSSGSLLGHARGTHANDGEHYGETDEDRFYGIAYPNGIGMIRMRCRFAWSL